MCIRDRDNSYSGWKGNGCALSNKGNDINEYIRCNTISFEGEPNPLDNYDIRVLVEEEVGWSSKTDNKICTSICSKDLSCVGYTYTNSDKLPHNKQDQTSGMIQTLQNGKLYGACNFFSAVNEKSVQPSILGTCDEGTEYNVYLIRSRPTPSQPTPAAPTPAAPTPAPPPAPPGPSVSYTRTLKHCNPNDKVQVVDTMSAGADGMKINAMCCSGCQNPAPIVASTLRSIVDCSSTRDADPDAGDQDRTYPFIILNYDSYGKKNGQIPYGADHDALKQCEKLCNKANEADPSSCVGFNITVQNGESTDWQYDNLTIKGKTYNVCSLLTKDNNDVTVQTVSADCANVDISTNAYYTFETYIKTSGPGPGPAPATPTPAPATPTPAPATPTPAPATPTPAPPAPTPNHGTHYDDYYMPLTYNYFS